MLYRLDRSGDTPKLMPVYDGMLQPDMSRRRVVLFAGAGLDLAAVSMRPQSVAGSIKYMEQLLTSSRYAEGAEPIDIYIHVYEESFQEMQRNAAIARDPAYLRYERQLGHEVCGHDKDAHFHMKRAQPDFTPTILGARGLGKVLKPMLLAKGEDWNSLTPEMLKQRLSTLTFASHSFGGIVIQHIADAMLYELRQAGWKDETIAEVMKELVAVNVAGVGRVDYPQPNFTQFHFEAVNDRGALTSIYRDKPEDVDYATALEQCGYWRVAEMVREHGFDRPSAELMAKVKEHVDDQRVRRGVNVDAGDMPKPIWRQQQSGYSIHGMLPEDAVRWIEQRPDGTKHCRVLLGAPDPANPQAGSHDSGTHITHDFRNFMHGGHHMGDVLINVMNNAVTRDVGIGDGHQLATTTPLTARQHGMRHQNYQHALVSERGIVRESGGSSLQGVLEQTRDGHGADTTGHGGNGRG